jgi:glutamate-5-semialdehyde dehydrogenase
VSTVEAVELKSQCRQIAERARSASRELATLSAASKNAWLLRGADAIDQAVAEILEANQRDVVAAPEYGLSDAQIDRLVLDAERVAAISQAVRQIAALPDPIGETLEGSRRPNGLEIRKVRVPLGSVFFIYESRPNVTVDAAAICVKSGNAVILRGGKEARHSSQVMVDRLRSVAEECGVPEDAVQLVDTTDREAVGHFLSFDDLIDVAIPRGGKGLIERVAREARMPVIKHFDGNCHVYLDRAANPKQAVAIVVNSKCQRMGVCNACESLLVHQAVAEQLLPPVLAALEEYDIEIRGDEHVCQLWPNANRADESDWAAEYLGPILSVRVVQDTAAAIAHINRYGSHHTDAIVTDDLLAAQAFTAGIDSSAVIVNASTRFNDGGEFGFGAEIGISTDKFHARGPCGLKELTTYKYIVMGEGQVR